MISSVERTIFNFNVNVSLECNKGVALKPGQPDKFMENLVNCQIVSDDYLSRQVINELQEMDSV